MSVPVRYKQPFRPVTRTHVTADLLRYIPATPSPYVT
jgi:hypothetical protein